MPPLHRGTSLLTLSVDEGIAAAADDLVYETRNGVAVPQFCGVPKIFIASDRVIIGSTAMMWMKFSEPIPFEYKVDDWIAEFIAPQKRCAECDPEEVAIGIYQKARQSFEPIDSLIKEGKWNKQIPGDTLTSYVVVGYTKDFRQQLVFHIWVRFNADGKGLDFLTPVKTVMQFRQLWWLGEDQFFLRATQRLSPEVELLWRRQFECASAIDKLLPDIHPHLKESVSYIAGLIKVEAYFNKNKVGKAVNVAVIDRVARRIYSTTL
jgi:hypothetical protein